MDNLVIVEITDPEYGHETITSKSNTVAINETNGVKDPIDMEITNKPKNWILIKKFDNVTKIINRNFKKLSKKEFNKIKEEIKNLNDLNNNYTIIAWKKLILPTIDKVKNKVEESDKEELKQKSEEKKIDIKGDFNKTEKSPKIKSGDTISQIVLDHLTKYNNKKTYDLVTKIGSTKIILGKVIDIPEIGLEGYKVKKWDSLSKIIFDKEIKGKYDYKELIERTKKLNNGSDVVIIGKTIKLPVLDK